MQGFHNSNTPILDDVLFNNPYIKEAQTKPQVPILLTNILNKTHELNFTIPAPHQPNKQKPQYYQSTIGPTQTTLPTFLYSRFTTKHKTTIAINPIQNTQ